MRAMIAPRRCDAGFSYIEVVLAVLLLAVCLVPAMDAVRDSFAAPQIAQSVAAAQQCVKNHMEKVIAEPYQNLLNEAPASVVAQNSALYSLPADANCPARTVVIMHYDPTVSVPATHFVTADVGLLFVSVGAPAPAPTFSTLVAR